MPEVKTDEGKRFYDWLVANGQLDPGQYPAGDDSYALALSSPKNQSELKKWRDAQKPLQPDFRAMTADEKAKAKQPTTANQRQAEATKAKSAEKVASDMTVSQPKADDYQYSDPQPDLLDAFATGGLAKKTSDATDAIAEAVESGKTMGPGKDPDPVEPAGGVAQPEAKPEAKPEVSLAEPGAPVGPKDTPAEKAIKQETALPVAPTTYQQTKTQPDFWEQAFKVAQGLGKSIFEVIANAAAGYAGQPTPISLKRQREHDLAMEGKRHANSLELAKLQNEHASNMAAVAFQREKELTAINQAYDAKKSAAAEKLSRDLATASNDLQRQQIQNTYNLTLSQIEASRQANVIAYLFQKSKDGGADALYGKAEE